MAPAFKHSLIGYDPVSVASQLDAVKQEFAVKLDEFRQEKSALIYQNELLRAEVERLKQEITVKFRLKDDISNRLVAAYLKSMEKFLAVSKKAEADERELANKIFKSEEEFNRLRTDKEKMRDEFLAIVDRHRVMLLREEGDESDVRDQEQAVGSSQERSRQTYQ